MGAPVANARVALVTRPMSVAALKRLRLAPDWWTTRDEVRYRWRTVRRWVRRRRHRAADVLAELVADMRKLPPHQDQAGGDVIISAGVPEGTPSAERGHFWATVGAGPDMGVMETSAEREARERADYELLAARLRHPAGKDRP